MKNIQKNLQDRLRYLKRAGAVRLKLSTEDEGLFIPMVARMHTLFSRILPVSLKIGGPEARADIVQAYHAGIRDFISPMIESEFSLRKFLSMKKYLGRARVGFSINIETTHAVKNLPEIIRSADFRELQRVHIGRGDLSRSMNATHVDSPVMIRTLRKITRLLNSEEKSFSIGGGVLPQKIEEVLSRFMPDFFNTRNILFDTNKTKHPRGAVREALLWEIDFLRLQEKSSPLLAISAGKRIRELRQRMDM